MRNEEGKEVGRKGGRRTERDANRGRLGGRRAGDKEGGTEGGTEEAGGRQRGAEEARGKYTTFLHAVDSLTHVLALPLHLGTRHSLSSHPRARNFSSYLSESRMPHASGES